MTEHMDSEQAFEDQTAEGMRPEGVSGRRSEEDFRSRATDYLRSWVSDRIILSGVKLRKTSKALKNTGNCFEEEDQHLIGDYVMQAADRVDRLSSYLQDTPLEQITEDARQCSLKRPWLFMGACFTTGIVLARFLKASQRRTNTEQG